MMVLMTSLNQNIPSQWNEIMEEKAGVRLSNSVDVNIFIRKPDSLHRCSLIESACTPAARRRCRRSTPLTVRIIESHARSDSSERAGRAGAHARPPGGMAGPVRWQPPGCPFLLSRALACHPMGIGEARSARATVTSQTLRWPVGLRAQTGSETARAAGAGLGAGVGVGTRGLRSYL